MAKYINADEAKVAINRNMDMQDLYLPYEFINLIDEMPSANVVEVVWCKDCKYFLPHKDGYHSLSETDGMCDFFDLGRENYDYCSFAKRKEAENG